MKLAKKPKVYNTSTTADLERKNESNKLVNEPDDTNCKDPKYPTSKQHNKHFEFPNAVEDPSEEIFAQNFQNNEPEEVKEDDILPYTETPENDLGLSIRGVKWRPELTIEAINAEDIKLPICGTATSPMADNALSDFPALSPFGCSMGIINFPKTPKGEFEGTEASNKVSDKS